MEIEITAQIHQEDGSYWAEVLEAPGLFASGDSLEELTQALVEAWVLYHADDSNPVVVDCSAKVVSSPARVDEMKILVPA